MPSDSAIRCVFRRSERFFETHFKIAHVNAPLTTYSGKVPGVVADRAENSGFRVPVENVALGEVVAAD
jgi:hypothetical protein